MNLTFSLTLDSLGTVLVGSGIRTAAVVLQPLCIVSDFPDSNGNPYPGATVDSGDFIACGPTAGTEIEFEAPGKCGIEQRVLKNNAFSGQLFVLDCDEPIPIFYPDCQIRASAQMSSETKPANSIKAAEEKGRD